MVTRRDDSEPNPPDARRSSVWPWLRRVAAGLLGGAAAWVACNGPWADAAPQPVPVALQERPAEVPPERNGFVLLQGLDAPRDADVLAAGLAALQGQFPPTSARLGWPDTPLWRCRPDQQDCVSRWRAQPEALAQHLASAAVLGARCEHALGAEGFEEPQAARPAVGPLAQTPWPALPTPRHGEVLNCVRWFGLQAVAAPDAASAEAALARAHRFALRALQGARSLIGVQIASHALRHHWLLCADLVAAGRLERSAQVRLLTPLPPAALSPRAWVPNEARFSRETMRDLTDDVRGCHQPTDMADASPVGWLAQQLCRTRLGMLPEQTAQDGDALWVARLALLPDTGPAPCEMLQSPLWRGADSAWPSWRNTVSRWLRDVPAVDWSGYAAGQLDLDLLRQTLLARAQRQALPAGVQVTPVDGVPHFRGCRAQLAPEGRETRVRLPGA